MLQVDVDCGLWSAQSSGGLRISLSKTVLHQRQQTTAAQLGHIKPRFQYHDIAAANDHTAMFLLVMCIR